MNIDVRDTVAFFGYKCMIDCTYWYNKDLNPEFDFDVAGGYANFTDDIIMSEGEKIQQYILSAPVILMIRSSICSSLIDRGGRVFNKHSGICSYRCSDSQIYSHMSMPDTINLGLVFAVIARGTRECVCLSGNKYGVKACNSNGSLWFEFNCRRTFESPIDFYKNYSILHHGITDLRGEWELSDYLFERAMLLREKLSINASDLVSEHTTTNKSAVQNQTVVNTAVAANDKSERCDGIWELFKNKGKMADRYQKLIDALNSIDSSIVQKLDKVLCESDCENSDVSAGDDTKSILSAARLMGGS